MVCKGGVDGGSEIRLGFSGVADGDGGNDSVRMVVVTDA